MKTNYTLNEILAEMKQEEKALWKKYKKLVK